MAKKRHYNNNADPFFCFIKSFGIGQWKLLEVLINEKENIFIS